MSIYNDFQQVWLQRFPENPLPEDCTWEDYIRTNLVKHQQRVKVLKEEVRNEEVYIEYLERLIQDIGKQKKETSEGEHENQEGDGGETDQTKNNGRNAKDTFHSITTTVQVENESLDFEAVSDDKITNVSPSEAPSSVATTNTNTNNADNTNLPLNLGEVEFMTANMCVTEISNELSKLTTTAEGSNAVSGKVHPNEPSSFVTVIEVNGLKTTDSPPKLPVKPTFFRNNSVQSNPVERQDSFGSSLERGSTPDEPYYDIVAAEDQEFATLGSDNSSNENTLSSTASFAQRTEKRGAESPNASNYVNIEYFIQSTEKHVDDHSSSDEEAPEIRHRVSNGSYASSSSLEISTPSAQRKFRNASLGKIENDNESSGEKSMYKYILFNIIDSEKNYVEWLGVLIKYMKAIQATMTTSKPIVTELELNKIFYKIPELHSLHSAFLESLKSALEKPDERSGNFGELFKTMATNLELYGSFLGNYGCAVDTVRKCCETNMQFSNITKNIVCKQLSKQPIMLEDILHKPVARVQKNALVLHDLLNGMTATHPDFYGLSEALQMTQHFLDQFNMNQTKSMFPATDRAQRRLVKNSFIVEFADGHRKLRHLFLFNDVIACAKYKSSGGRTEKYTFELKWFIPVEDIMFMDETGVNFLETSTSNIVSLKSQASNIRDQLRQEEKAIEEKKIRSSRGMDKFKKRLVELESQLVLVSPNLQFRLKHRQNARVYTFFFSSDFDRGQWVEAIGTLQRAGKPPASNFTMFELQTWTTACRAYLKTNMGSYLLRSGQDESLLVGDLHVHVCDLGGLEKGAEIYVVLEVDFYGHFFQKAKTKTVQANATSGVVHFNEQFILDVEGCENLRALVYRTNNSVNNGGGGGDNSSVSPSSAAVERRDTLVGKFTQKLSRTQHESVTEKTLTINNTQPLRLTLKYVPCEVSLRRIPTGKSGALFGEKFQLVCKRQKRNVPFIVTACIREVERRGMQEVGLYRVSGSASDITKLKKLFETNAYEAEQFLKEVDIHSVSGILKLYLRQLPEALFTDHSYPSLLEAFNQTNGNVTRRIELLKECFSKLPVQNQATINFILEHLIQVNKHENENKMSLHNLATVFGPTLLRPGTKAENGKQCLETCTVDVMAQAGILYSFLQHLNNP